MRSKPLMKRDTWGWAHPTDAFGHSKETSPHPLRTSLATLTKLAKRRIEAARQADPKHGLRWQSLRKAVEHSHSSHKDILEQVAIDLESNPLQAPQP